MRTNRYEAEVKRLEQVGALRTLPHTQVDGKYIVTASGRLLNLCSNDYLGLLERQDIREGFVDSLSSGKLRAMSSASSRLLTGNDGIYEEYESYLSEVYHAESALIWGSGYHANSGILPVIADSDTLIVADKLVHASIIDGIRASTADFVRFRHSDMAHLRQILEAKADSYQCIWIVVESIYSMDGDAAPLREIIALKALYPHVFVYVDEAHGMGVFGGGLGYTVELGLNGGVDILMGTLGKAMGSYGAFSVQSSTLRTLMVNKARPMIYTTALPPCYLEWSLYAFRQVVEMDAERRHLRSLCTLMSALTGLQSGSSIYPLIVPGNAAVSRAADEMTAHGYYVRPIRRPTVPAGGERLRLSLTAAMTEEEVRDLSQIIRQCRSNIKTTKVII